MRKKQPEIITLQVPNSHLSLTEIIQRLDRFDRWFRGKITRLDIRARMKLDPKMRSKQPGDGVYVVSARALKRILQESFSGEVSREV